MTSLLDPDARGRVILVGAGPGDPGLLTVRAVEALSAADVVVHDGLIDPRVLEIAPVALLLALCAGLTVLAGPATGYMEAAARSLHAPQGYVAGVLPAPGTAGGAGR